MSAFPKIASAYPRQRDISPDRNVTSLRKERERAMLTLKKSPLSSEER